MATKGKIGLREVRALPPNSEIFDAGTGSVPGFYVRRRVGAASAYGVFYRTAEGRQRRHTIGTAGAPWTPDMAREEARRLLAEVAKGNDPAGDKQVRREAATVADLCDLYLADATRGLVIGKRGAAKKPSTLVTDRSRISAQIKPLIGAMKVPAITPQDVRAFMAAVMEGKAAKRVATGKKRGLSNVRGGKGAATRTMGLLGGIFTYAVQQKMRTDNPVTGIQRHADGVKDRRLSDDEYAALAAGLRKVSQPAERKDGKPGASMWPPAVAAARLLVLTGWRMSEVLGLRYDAADLKARVATLADSKTGRSIRPLSKAACDLIAAQQRVEGSPLVFPASRGEGCMTGFPSMFARIVKASELPESLTCHTLRHSFASLAADLGYSDATIAQLIGHKGGGITRRYIHTADAVLLAAADAVANETLNRMGENNRNSIVIDLAERKLIA